MAIEQVAIDSDDASKQGMVVPETGILRLQRVVKAGTNEAFSADDAHKHVHKRKRETIRVAEHLWVQAQRRDRDAQSENHRDGRVDIGVAQGHMWPEIGLE